MPDQDDTAPVEAVAKAIDDAAMRSDGAGDAWWWREGSALLLSHERAANELRNKGRTMARAAIAAVREHEAAQRPGPADSIGAAICPDCGKVRDCGHTCAIATKGRDA